MIIESVQTLWALCLFVIAILAIVMGVIAYRSIK